MRIWRSVAYVGLGMLALGTALFVWLFLRPQSIDAQGLPPVVPLPVAAAGELAPVVSITDGDTFRALVDGQSVPVRILGIDTPELRGKQCYSAEATAKLTDLLTNQQVVLTQDPEQGNQDRYGRLLRYVMTPDGTDVGQYLIRYGYAEVYQEYPVARTPDYLTVQVQAQQEGRGLWTDCRP